MTQLPVTEADLQSYIDGHRPESRRTEIEAYLAARPDEAERVLAYRLQTETLRVLFNPVLSEPVPARLTGVPQAKNWMLQRWAASVAIAVAGGAAGWTLHGQMDEPGVSTQAQRSNRIAEGRQVANLARQAAIAHVVYSPDVKRPVEIGADQEEQLVTWLSKRIGRVGCLPERASSPGDPSKTSIF